MKTIRSPRKGYFIEAAGLLIALLGLWLPFYIGGELLPAGWAKQPDTHWWTFPTGSMLIVFGVGSIAGGIWMMLRRI